MGFGQGVCYAARQGPTLGRRWIKARNTARTWALVINGTRCRILHELSASGDDALPELVLRSEARNLRDIMDRPGRSFASKRAVAALLARFDASLGAGLGAGLGADRQLHQPFGGKRRPRGSTISPSRPASLSSPRARAGPSWAWSSGAFLDPGWRLQDDPAGKPDDHRQLHHVARHTPLMLLQDADNLLFGSYRSRHRPSSPWSGLQSQSDDKSRGRPCLATGPLLVEVARTANTKKGSAGATRPQ